MSRPEFVNELLSRPLAPLTPRKLTDNANPPFRNDLQNAIADLHVHPLLESALHLMNDDLFSAHFLLRKMQEDAWGKWLHACLHLAEGDLDRNAKLWYQDCDRDLLSRYWKGADPHNEAIQAMYEIQKIHREGHQADAKQVERCQKIKWQELVKIFEELEREKGWEPVDGKQFYTQDEKPEHKSNVLGEGWRKVDGT